MTDIKTDTEDPTHGPRLLRMAIADRGMSKSDAATSVGLSGPQLSQFLHGRRVPSLSQAAKIDDELGVPSRSWLSGWRP